MVDFGRKFLRNRQGESLAYDEIVKGSGTQFDPTVVEAFKKAYSKINAVRVAFADR